MAGIAMDQRQRRSPENQTLWRFFPLAIALALGFVAVVNAVMIAQALGTFPGEAGVENGYDLSNAYDKILSNEQAQESLGWKLVVFGRDQHLVVRLTDRDAAALTGVDLTATATRPVGPEDTVRLRFAPDGDGHYVSAEPLELGQWLVDITATAPGRHYIVTRRVIIR